MLAKQLAVGATPGSLVTYLFGPGTANEHADQRLIGGSESLVAAFGAVDLRGDVQARSALTREFDGAWRQVRREKRLPLTPDADESVRGAARSDRVFHAVLSLGRDEGTFSDELWQKAARMFVAEMRFIDSDEGADCAWMAVHHGFSKEGNDHVHIAVNLVREDGRRASLHQSKRRTAQAGARVAKAMGKEAVFAQERSSGIGNVSRAEIERGQREQRDADRLVVRRRLAAAAATATSEADFVRKARGAGLLVRPRFESGGVSRVSGYSVALGDAGKPIWFAPSKLDKSLGLRALRERKEWSSDAQLEAVSAWRDSSKREKIAAPMIRKDAPTFQGYGSDLSWQPTAGELSDVLSAWAVQSTDGKGGYLARASDALSRASQPEYGARSTALIEGMKLAATVSLAASKNDTAAQLALVSAAISLIEALARAREASRELTSAGQQLERAMVPLRAERSFLIDSKRAQEIENLPPQARDAAQLAFGRPPRRASSPNAGPSSMQPRPEPGPARDHRHGPRQGPDTGRNS